MRTGAAVISCRTTKRLVAASSRLATALALMTLGCVAAAPVLAQTWVTYDASLGTLPQAQGWTLGEDINPPVAYIVGVTSGDLHLSTLMFGHNIPDDNGGGVWWQRTDVNIDFASDFTVEVTVRIASAPNHSINTQSGWPRPGYALTVYDIHGKIFWIGLGSEEVFLSNTSFGNYGSGNTVTTSFNTTDRAHVYRLERAPGGVGAALRIDGVIRLQLPALGLVENPGALLYFGDPTYWANSESYTSRVRYSNASLDVATPHHPTALWAAPPHCPAATLGVAFRSEESGALEFEVFDAAGRRVSRSEREVAAGQDGHLGVAGTHGDGLYFYRVRLIPSTGRASQVTGRIVLVR